MCFLIKSFELNLNIQSQLNVQTFCFWVDQAQILKVYGVVHPLSQLHHCSYIYKIILEIV